MAVLTDQARADLWSTFMRELSAERGGLALTKADLRAAVNGLDDLMSASETAINNAIPPPARSALTVPQKARLLMFVVRQRYLTGA